METVYRLSQIPGGLEGTDATVREIGRLVKYDLDRPQLRLQATRILIDANIQSKNHQAEAEALYDFVVRRIRYQKDPVGIETVQSPTITLSVGAGDCDDHSGLVVGLAQSVGIPARLKVVGYSKDHIEHILPELFVGGSWVGADTTEPDRGFGWTPTDLPFQRIYNLNGEVVNMEAYVDQRAISKNDFRLLVKARVEKILSSFWRDGRINLNDVKQYLRVIDGGGFPTRQPLLLEPTRAAFASFVDYVQMNKVESVKPDASGGMGGLGDWYDDIWDTVKDVGSDVLDTVVEYTAEEFVEWITDSGETVQVKVGTPAPAGATRKTDSLSQLLTGNTPILIAAGVAAFLLLRR